MAFTVAIVGRPNVGKSTLFNRLVGRKLALVDPTPGLTRDRREGEGSIAGLAFRIIDTAGYEEGEPDSMQARMWRQTEMALAEADVALLVMDARAGLTTGDEAFAQLVRASHKPVVLVANKCESGKSDVGFYDAFRLGMGEPVAISAEHGLGLGDLYDALAPLADANSAEAAVDRERPLRMAIVGRPNVGKSTLVNRLLGTERMLTGPEPGLTRDSIATEWEYEGHRVQLVDTAGMRRAARIDEPIEEMAVADARRSLGFAQVVVVVLDGSEPMARADLSVAAFVAEEGRAVLVAVNKADLIEDRAKALEELHERLANSLSQVRGVPTVLISARTGAGIEKLMPAVIRAYERWDRHIPTSELNRWLEAATTRNPPPNPAGRPIRLRYVTQAATRPPRIVLFTSKPKDLPDAYVRYLTNDLRDTFDLDGVPLRMTVRRSPGKPADFSLRKKKDD